MTVFFEMIRKGVFDDMELFMGSGGYADPWISVVGSGDLNLSVGQEDWSEADAWVGWLPHAEPRVTMQKEIEWQIEGVIVEKVPVWELEADEGQRGSNEPRG